MNNSIHALSDAEIIDFLHNEMIGHLGCYADGRIYVVPISYAFDGLNLYFHTYEGQKIAMMRKNPEVCFQIDNRANMAKWQSVIIWGTFKELEGEERKYALQTLLNRKLPIQSSVTTHLGATWPFTTDDIENINGITFAIHINEMTGRFEETKLISDYNIS